MINRMNGICYFLPSEVRSLDGMPTARELPVCRTLLMITRFLHFLSLRIQMQNITDFSTAKINDLFCFLILGPRVPFALVPPPTLTKGRRYSARVGAGATARATAISHASRCGHARDLFHAFERTVTFVKPVCRRYVGKSFLSTDSPRSIAFLG